jgi:hypothetical protein
LSCPTRRSSLATRWRRAAFSAWSRATSAAVSTARAWRQRAMRQRAEQSSGHGEASDHPRRALRHPNAPGDSTIPPECGPENIGRPCQNALGYAVCNSADSSYLSYRRGECQKAMTLDSPTASGMGAVSHGCRCDLPRHDSEEVGYFSSAQGLPDVRDSWSSRLRKIEDRALSQCSRTRRGGGEQGPPAPPATDLRGRRGHVPASAQLRLRIRTRL